MKRSTATVITTCIGLAAAGTAYMMSDNKDIRRKTKRFRRSAGKAMHQIGSYIENASYLMR